MNSITINQIAHTKGQNPLHQFPHSKSVTVTSWRGQKSVVSCRFRNSITTTCQLVADLATGKLHVS